MEKQKLTATSVNKKKKIIIGCAVGGGIVGIGLAVGLGVGLTQHKEQGDQYKIDNVPTPLNLNVYADIKIFKNGDLYNGFDNDGCTLVPRSNTTNITFSKVVDNGAHQVMQYSSANGIEEQKTVIIDLIDHSGNALCTFTVVLNPAGADSYSINCYGKLLSKGEDTTLHIARNNYYWDWKGEGCTLVPRNNTSNIDFTNIETGRERVTYVDDTGITAITTVIIDLQDASGNVLCSSFVELNPATTTDIYIIENPPEPLNLNGYVVFYVYKNWIGNWNMNSEGCTLVARSNTDNIKISATGCSGGSLQMVSYVSAAGINTQTRVTIDLKSSSGDVLCAFTVVLNP